MAVTVIQFDRRNFLATAGVVGLTASAGIGALSAQPVSGNPALVPLPDALARGHLIWDASAFGYQVDEYLVSGTGPTFGPTSAAEAGKRAEPGAEPLPWGVRDQEYAVNLPADYSAPPITGSAAYTTRIIVYRPRDMKKFSGNVVIETIHPVDYVEVFAVANRFLLTRGDIAVHIETPGLFEALKTRSPDRYGPLAMPNRTSFWTSLSQIATLIKSGGPGSPVPARPRHMYLTGYSGTADTTYTFLCWHHNLTRSPDGKPVFDGYLPMSRVRPVPPLDAVIVSAATQNDMFGASTGSTPQSRAFRAQYDSDAPNARRRRYEVPGPFHAPLESPEPGMAIPARDDYPVYEPCSVSGNYPKGAQRNNFPNRPVLEACFYHASRWVEKGIAPPRAPRIQTNAAGDTILYDANNNPLGGLRLPDIAVPTDTYVRSPAKTDPCAASGYRMPFTSEKLEMLYGTRAHYLALYDAVADKLVKDGFILPEGAAQMKTDRRWLAPVF